MRSSHARVWLKLVSLAFTVGLTVLGTRSCGASGASNSVVDPANLLKNGLAGVCADQQAVNSASGAQPGQVQITVPSQYAQAGQLVGLGQAVNCPPPTAP